MLVFVVLCGNVSEFTEWKNYSMHGIVYSKLFCVTEIKNIL